MRPLFALLASLALVAVFASSAAVAGLTDELLPTRNEYLREQIEGDSDRVLPRTENFYWAVDAEFFAPTNLGGQSTPYATRPSSPIHGTGYWIESRMELVPTKQIRLNLKLIPWYGTSSWGYANTARLLPLAGVSFDDSLLNSDWTIHTRFGDMGLQTIGMGILLQDQPMNGGEMEIRRDGFRYRLLVDGTGMFQGAGDSFVHTMGFWGDRLYFNIYHVGKEMPEPAIPTTYAAGSRYSWNERDFVGVELASNHSDLNSRALGFAMKADLRGEWGNFSGRARPSIRYYDANFLGELGTGTQLKYTGYDLQGISFANPTNLFVSLSDIWAPAARLTGAWRVYRSIELFTDQEFVQIIHGDTKVHHENRHFWSAGTRLYPIEGREDFATIAVSNKLLTVLDLAYDTNGDLRPSAVYPTDQDSNPGKPRFVEQLQFMVTVHTRF